MRTLIAAALMLALAVPASAERPSRRLIHDITTGDVCAGSCWSCMHGCTEAERKRLCCPKREARP
jgi:hypothetical protein